MTLKNSYFIANEGIKHKSPQSNNITLRLVMKYYGNKFFCRKLKLLFFLVICLFLCIDFRLFRTQILELK